MKQLYRVETYYYVMAEDEDDAGLIKPGPFFQCTTEAYKANIVEAEWMDAIPLSDDPNSDDDRTCEQILAAQRAERNEEVK